ncbi:putative dienelactone hydrolase, alpha/beta hydrolase, partial [Tanacetum coccineum]
PIKDGKGLTQLTVAFLAIDMFFAAIGILLSLLVGLGVCFCFPCIIGIMYLIRRQEEGASDADINILPKYIYAVSNDEEQPDLILSRMVPMGTNGPDFNVEPSIGKKNCPKMLGSPLTDTVNKSDTSRRIQQVKGREDARKVVDDLKTKNANSVGAGVYWGKYMAELPWIHDITLGLTLAFATEIVATCTVSHDWVSLRETDLSVNLLEEIIIQMVEITALGSVLMIFIGSGVSIAVYKNFITAGFHVVVPDFFYGDPYVPETPLSSWFRNHLPAKGAEEARKVVADLKSKGASAVGVAGFCWGGMTVSKLSSYGEIEAAIILHPGPLSDDDINAIKVPTAFLGAEIDEYSSPEQLKKFGELLSAKSLLMQLLHMYSDSVADIAVVTLLGALQSTAPHSNENISCL